MKTLFLTVFAFFTLNFLYAQDELPEIFPRDENNQIVFTEVVQVDSTLNKTQLYGNAKLFFANTFKSANDVIQLDDKDNGRVVGKGMSEVSGTRLYYTIQIDVKDGRYKYMIHNLYFLAYPDRFLPNPSPNPAESAFSKKRYYTKKGAPKFMMKDFKESIENEINALIQTLKDSMQPSQKNEASSDDW